MRKVKCPTCKGVKSIQTVGQYDGVQKMMSSTCYRCNGVGILDAPETEDEVISWFASQTSFKLLYQQLVQLRGGVPIEGVQLHKIVKSLLYGSNKVS